MVVRLLPALLAMSISSFGGEAQMLWVTVKDEHCLQFTGLARAANLMTKMPIDR